MAILNINWHGFDFERGLSILDQSLSAATGALELNRAAVQKQWDDYEAAVAAGAPEDVEWDDDIKVWDRGMAYENDLHMIQDAHGVMRKAHVIALYHLWERVVRGWTKAPASADHKRLRKLVEAKGIKVHPRLEAIRDLNNALKHNSEKSGPELLGSWPELFSDEFKSGIAERLDKARTDPQRPMIDWFEAIRINDGQMAEVVLALRTSGPVGGITNDADA